MTPSLTCPMKPGSRRCKEGTFGKLVRGVTAGKKLKKKKTEKEKEKRKRKVPTSYGNARFL